MIYQPVSTAEQGKSGLGLEAQRRDIALFLTNYVQEVHEIAGSFTEVQSGASDDRPELAKAVALAKLEGAELLVSKLDRLSRKVSFIALLMDDKKLQLRVASMPNAVAFQLHIYAALAEQERTFISLRTKAALAVAKSNGVKLGGLRDKTAKRNTALQVQATERAQKVADIILPLRDAKIPLRQIADAPTFRLPEGASGGLLA